MDIAKSIALGGELIAAGEGAYIDCMYFNMVCTVCGESVIWRKDYTRTYPDGKEVWIPPVWCHRRQRHRLHAQDCELRCKQFSKEKREQMRAESKNQRYALVQNSVWEMWVRQNGFSNLPKSHPKYESHKIQKQILLKCLNGSKVKRNLRRLCRIFKQSKWEYLKEELEISLQAIQLITDKDREKAIEYLNLYKNSAAIDVDELVQEEIELAKDLKQNPILHKQNCLEILDFLHKEAVLSVLFKMFFNIIYAEVERSLLQDGKRLLSSIKQEDVEEHLASVSVDYFIKQLVISIAYTNWVEQFSFAFLAAKDNNNIYKGVGFGKKK